MTKHLAISLSRAITSEIAAVSLILDVEKPNVSLTASSTSSLSNYPTPHIQHQLDKSNRLAGVFVYTYLPDPLSNFEANSQHKFPIQFGTSLLPIKTDFGTKSETRRYLSTVLTTVKNTYRNRPQEPRPLLRKPNSSINDFIYQFTNY